MRTKGPAAGGRQEAAAGGELEITLLNPNRYPEAAARRLRPWLAALLAELAPGCRGLGVRFAGDRAMRRANRQFRGKDQTTDVLSFPGSERSAGAARQAGAAGSPGAPGCDAYLGDILISVPAARRQAAAGLAAEGEVRVLLLHGALHCLGYDHETDGGKMARLERRLRRRWIGGGTRPGGSATPDGGARSSRGGPAALSAGGKRTRHAS